VTGGLIATEKSAKNHGLENPEKRRLYRLWLLAIPAEINSHVDRVKAGMMLCRVRDDPELGVHSMLSRQGPIEPRTVDREFHQRVNPHFCAQVYQVEIDRPDRDPQVCRHRPALLTL
jgi:hypothetical protein